MRLRGAWVALPTVLTSEGDPDADAVRGLVERLREAEVDGLWLLGSTGLGLALDDRTARAYVEAVLDADRGPLGVVVGCSAGGTTAALLRAAVFAGLDVDGFFALPPLSYRCTQREVVLFYEQLADGLPKPLVLYNNPGVCANALDVASVVALSGNDDIVGIKDSSGDRGTLLGVARGLTRPREFGLLQGDEALLTHLGPDDSDGAVTAMGAIRPREMVALVRAALEAGAEAPRMHAEVQALSEELGWTSGTDIDVARSLLAELARQGLGTGEMPSPFGRARPPRS